MSAIKIGTISEKFHCNYEFEWSIEKFMSLTVHKYESPTFSVPGLECCLHILTDFDFKDTSSLVVKIKSGNKKNSKRFGLKMRNVDGEVRVLWEDLEEEDEYLDEIFTLKKIELWPSGDLTIVCFLRIHDCYAESLLKLSTDYEKMFKSKNCCDAALRIQNEEIPVHKSVLASRSPVFEAMFEVDMTEKKTGVVNIEDCDPQHFKHFLFYIYSGKLEVGLSFGDICELYKIAHKYDERELKSACVCYIKNRLCVDTVIDAAIIGHHFHEDELKSKVQDFFNQNFAKVISTDKWVDLLKNAPSLANGLLKEMAEYTTGIDCTDSDTD